MAVASTPRNEWQRIAGTTQVLVRSRIEIARLLGDILTRETPVCAFFVGDKALFVSQLRYVDADQNYLLINYSNNRMANGALLSSEKTVFSSIHPWGNLEFLASRISEAKLGGDLAIRVDFPESVLLNQRRVHRRIKAIPEVPLDCLAGGPGIKPFACKITDISAGGLGALMMGDAVALKPGAVLNGCRITYPGGSATVDIEVKHCSRVTLADGRAGLRAGCRFIGPADEVERLAKIFVLDMEDK